MQFSDCRTITFFLVDSVISSSSSSGLTCFGTVWPFWCWCAVKHWYNNPFLPQVSSCILLVSSFTESADRWWGHEALLCLGFFSHLIATGGTSGLNADSTQLSQIVTSWTFGSLFGSDAPDINSYSMSVTIYVSSSRLVVSGITSRVSCTVSPPFRFSPRTIVVEYHFNRDLYRLLTSHSV